MKNKLIYYVGDIGTPNNAKSIHAKNLGILLNSINFKVIYLCEQYSNQEIISNNELLDYIYTKKFFKKGKLASLEWLIESLSGMKIYLLLKKNIKINKPDYVILYGYQGEKRILKLCHKLSIPVILERVDWFEKDDRIGFLNKYLIHPYVEKCMNKIDTRANGIIAISKYLSNYYESKGCTVINIPPVFEMDSTLKTSNNDSNELTLVYAGSIAKNKDDITSVIDSITDINKDRVRIYFDIVGLLQDNLPNQYHEKDLSQYGIRFYGRIPNEEATKIIKNADFSVLLRQNKRYSKAGFSTKLAESMCLGIPVICTKVGGSDNVITNMVDGVLIEDNNYQTIRKLLIDLLSLNKNQIKNLKMNAYKTACNIFSIQSYQSILNDFLTRL